MRIDVHSHGSARRLAALCRPSVSAFVASARARGWRGAGAPGAGPRCARLPCGARTSGPPPNSLRSLRSLRSDTRGESAHEAREYARGRKSCAPRLRTGRPGTAPPSGLETGFVFAPTKTHAVSARRRAGRRRGDLCAAEKRRLAGRARTRAPRELTCRTLFERSERSERSELCGRPASRASQGSLAQRGPAPGAPAEPRPATCSRR
jgi:hypothetical protein